MICILVSKWLSGHPGGIGWLIMCQYYIVLKMQRLDSLHFLQQLRLLLLVFQLEGMDEMVVPFEISTILISQLAQVVYVQVDEAMHWALLLTEKHLLLSEEVQGTMSLDWGMLLLRFYFVPIIVVLIVEEGTTATHDARNAREQGNCGVVGLHERGPKMCHRRCSCSQLW